MAKALSVIYTCVDELVKREIGPDVVDNSSLAKKTLLDIMKYSGSITNRRVIIDEMTEVIPALHDKGKKETAEEFVDQLFLMADNPDFISKEPLQRRKSPHDQQFENICAKGNLALAALSDIADKLWDMPQNHNSEIGKAANSINSRLNKKLAPK